MIMKRIIAETSKGYFVGRLFTTEIRKIQLRKWRLKFFIYSLAQKKAQRLWMSDLRLFPESSTYLKPFQSHFDHKRRAVPFFALSWRADAPNIHCGDRGIWPMTIKNPDSEDRYIRSPKLKMLFPVYAVRIARMKFFSEALNFDW